MARARKYSDEEMIAALVSARGMVYHAAARVGCDADTIYNRAKSSPEVAAAMKAERGKMVDTAEQKLYDAVVRGEPWAIQLALKTLGKDRGYVERAEHAGVRGAPVEITFIEVPAAQVPAAAPALPEPPSEVIVDAGGG